MNITKTRTRKLKGAQGNISRGDKLKIDIKRVDDLESDVLEGFISSNESLSDFEVDGMDEEGFKDDKKRKGGAKLGKKGKKVKKDKRNTLMKSKVNLKQMLADMERKQQTEAEKPRVLIDYLSVGVPIPEYKAPPAFLCSICLRVAKYSCPRCSDRYCTDACLRHHKEYVCAHLEYNYYY